MKLKLGRQLKSAWGFRQKNSGRFRGLSFLNKSVGVNLGGDARIEYIRKIYLSVMYTAPGSYSLTGVNAKFRQQRLVTQPAKFFFNKPYNSVGKGRKLNSAWGFKRHPHGLAFLNKATSSKVNKGTQKYYLSDFFFPNKILNTTPRTIKFTQVKSILKPEVMRIGVGQFTFNGNNVQLLHHGKIFANVASYNFTAPDSLLLQQRRFVLEPASFEFTGIDVIFSGVKISGSSSLIVDSTIVNSFVSRIQSSSSLTLTPRVTFHPSATISAKSVVSPSLHRIGDPSIFGLANIQTNSTIGISGGIIVNAICSIGCNSILNLNYHAYEVEKGELILVVDLYVPEPLGISQKFRERLTVDSNVLSVKNWSLQQNENEVAPTLNVELAKVSDGFVINPDSIVTFETSKYVNGSWTPWKIKVSTDRVGSKNYTISRNDGGPNDSCKLSLIPKLQQNVNTWAKQNIIFFDPQKTKVTEDDIENLVDQTNSPLTTLILGTRGLSWKYIASFLYSAEGPFSGISSDIFDWPIIRVDVGIGDNVKDIIGSLVGMFKPDFYQGDSGEVVIKSTIFHKASTFPGGIQIPVYEVVSTETSYTDRHDSDISGYKINYAATKNNFDPENVTYTTKEHTELVTERAKDEDEEDAFVTTTVVTTIAQYRTKKRPDSIIRSEIINVVRTTVLDWTEVSFDDSGNESRAARRDTIQTSVENFYFDDMGNQNARTKTISALVPMPDDDDATNWTLQFIQVSNEWEAYDYRAHPFNSEKIYLASRQMSQEGLIYVDEENTQVTGESFAQEALKAYRNGNITDNQKSYTGQIKAVYLTGEPVDRETVRQRTTEIDCIARSIVTDSEDVQAGDIGTSGATGSVQKKLLVIKPGAVTGRIETLSTGEMPVNNAIDLASALLAQGGEESKNDASLICIGLRDEVQINTGISPLNRNGAVLGSYQVRGWIQSGGYQEPYLTTIKGKFGA